MIEVLIISIAILITAIIALILINRNIRKKVVVDIRKELLNQIRVANLVSNPQEKLNALSHITKDFLDKKYELRKSLSYPELEAELTRKGKLGPALLCKNLGEAFYQPRVFEKSQINYLLQTLESLVKEEPKKEIKEEKVRKKESFLDKITIWYKINKKIIEAKREETKVEKENRKKIEKTKENNPPTLKVLEKTNQSLKEPLSIKKDNIFRKISLWYSQQKEAIEKKIQEREKIKQKKEKNLKDKIRLQSLEKARLEKIRLGMPKKESIVHKIGSWYKKEKKIIEAKREETKAESENREKVRQEIIIEQKRKENTEKANKAKEEIRKEDENIAQEKKITNAENNNKIERKEFKSQDMSFPSYLYSPIDSLLAKGELFLSNEDKINCNKTYQEIKTKFDSSPNKTKEDYDKIIRFYNKIVQLK